MNLNQKNILSLITDTPGLHFRELSRRVTMGNGTLEYHLKQLCKNGVLQAHHFNNTKLFFLHSINEQECKLLIALRHDRMRKVLGSILINGTLTHKQVQRYTELPASTSSRLLKSLVQLGAVEKRRHQTTSYFSVKDKMLVEGTLKQFKSSLPDIFTARFASAWQ